MDRKTICASPLSNKSFHSFIEIRPLVSEKQCGNESRTDGRMDTVNTISPDDFKLAIVNLHAAMLLLFQQKDTFIYIYQPHNKHFWSDGAPNVWNVPSFINDGIHILLILKLRVHTANKNTTYIYKTQTYSEFMLCEASVAEWLRVIDLESLAHTTVGSNRPRDFHVRKLSS